MKAKEKHYYQIKLEALIPATLTYRILAEDEKEALKIFEQNPGQPTIQYKLNLKRKIKLVIYDWGTTLIKFVKNF